MLSGGHRPLSPTTGRGLARGRPSTILVASALKRSPERALPVPPPPAPSPSPGASIWLFSEEDV